mgnify:CR=1 FL=1
MQHTMSKYKNNYEIRMHAMVYGSQHESSLKCSFTFKGEDKPTLVWLGLDYINLCWRILSFYWVWVVSRFLDLCEKNPLWRSYVGNLSVITFSYVVYYYIHLHNGQSDKISLCQYLRYFGGDSIELYVLHIIGQSFPEMDMLLNKISRSIMTKKMARLLAISLHGFENLDNDRYLCKVKRILNQNYLKEQHRKGYESISWAQLKNEFIKTKTNHLLNVTILIVSNVDKVGIVHTLCFARNIMFVLSPWRLWATNKVLDLNGIPACKLFCI